MELSSLSENIVTERFERNGEWVALQINIDAIVPDYYEVLQERLEPVARRLDELGTEHKKLQGDIKKAAKQQAKSKRAKPSVDMNQIGLRVSAIRKEVEQLEKEIFAERLTCPISLPDGSLTCLLKGWDTTEKGVAIAPSKENLLRLPSKTVKAIWMHVEPRLETVKKTADNEMTQNPTTLETTETGSQEFTIPLNAQVM